MATPHEALDSIMTIEGAVGTAIVDYQSGVTLASRGGGDMDMELAGAGNTRVMHLVLDSLGQNDIDDPIEDVLVTLDGQVHLTRVSDEHDSIFTYLILDREEGNLALSRRQLIEVESNLELDDDE
jgi:hypothetical protein